jgi:hypothetical protein
VYPWDVRDIFFGFGSSPPLKKNEDRKLFLERSTVATPRAKQLIPTFSVLRKNLLSLLIIGSVTLLQDWTSRECAAAAVSDSSSIEVAFDRGLLSLKAEEASAAEVLAAIGKKAGFNTIIRVVLPSESTAWSFTAVPLLEVIDRMVGPLNKAFFLIHGIPGLPSLWFTTISSEVPLSKQPPQRNDLDKQDDVDTINHTKAFEINLGSPDAEARIRAISLLGALGTGRVIPILGQVLFGDKDSAVRAAAVDALAQKKGMAATAFLREAQRTRTVEFVTRPE